jgi:hypothetical protein
MLRYGLILLLIFSGCAGRTLPKEDIVPVTSPHSIEGKYSNKCENNHSETLWEFLERTRQKIYNHRTGDVVSLRVDEKRPNTLIANLYDGVALVDSLSAGFQVNDKSMQLDSYTFGFSYIIISSYNQNNITLWKANNGSLIVGDDLISLGYFLFIPIAENDSTTFRMYQRR